MTVITSPEAADDLDAIWRWNADRNGVQRADEYLAFLRAEISHLDVKFSHAPKIGGSSDWRYITIRQTSRGHGYVAVFEVKKTVINVLRVYHTAQDWQRPLAP